MKRRIEKPWSEVLYLIGITIAVYFGLFYLLPLVLPFFLAVIFAALLHPIVKKLENKGRLPRGLLSVIVIVLALLLVGVPLLLLIYKLIREFCHLVSGYSTWKGEVENIWFLCCDRIEQLSGFDASQVLSRGSSGADSVIQKIQDKVVPFLMNCSISGIKGIAGFFWKLIVTIVATVLTLTDYPKLRAKFLQTTAGRIANRIGIDMMHAAGTYIRAQLIIWLSVSAICVAGLILSGNRYALLVGLGIGLCDALPFVGTGIIFVPWLILKLFQGEYLLAVLYGALYIICNITREFLEPKLVGRGLGIHPLAVIFSIYVGICVYGGVGIVLGPLSALLIWELYKIRKEFEMCSDTDIEG